MSIHHCFFRSEYMKSDFDESWNRINLSIETHHAIHHEGAIGTELRYKREALKKYTGEHLAELERIYKSKLYKYGNKRKNTL